MEAVLFPLPGLILSPGGKVTLNIFEPRYLKMVKDALKDDVPMAIAHASKTHFKRCISIPDPGYPYICSDVGYGKIEVLAETPRGLLIAVNSQGKAHVEYVNAIADPYIKLELNPINLNNQLSDDHSFLFRRIRALTRDKLEGHLKTQQEVDILMGQLTGPNKLLAFYIDHILQDWSQKFDLFQLDDINQKIQLLGKMIVNKH